MSKIRGLTQIMAGTISASLFVSGLNLPTTQLQDGALFVKSDGTVAMTAALALGNNRITGLADPTNPQDAATKNYVDAAVQGLNIKSSVRALSTTNVTLSGPGTTIDGLTAANGEAYALNGQTTPSQNGIYVFNGAASAMTRRNDADTAAKLRSAFVFVESGTSADKGFVQTADNVTLGTTALTFTQFSGAGQITGGQGLVLTGNTLDVGAGLGITVNPDDVQIKLNASNPGLALSASGLSVAFSGGSLGTDATGLKILSLSGLSLTGVTLAGGTLSNGKLLLGSAGGLATEVSFSGDATVSNTGVVAVATTLLRKVDDVSREVPSGTINGANVNFTLAGTPVANSELVWLNGLLQTPTTDYSVAGAVVTFVAAPATGDVVLVGYLK